MFYAVCFPNFRSGVNDLHWLRSTSDHLSAALMERYSPVSQIGERCLHSHLNFADSRGVCSGSIHQIAQLNVILKESSFGDVYRFFDFMTRFLRFFTLSSNNFLNALHELYFEKFLRICDVCLFIQTN